MQQKRMTTKKLVMTAVLAALVAVTSGIRIVLTEGAAFHLGNIMCALSGILLGPWFGGLAAGLGSAIYDMTNPLYISECWMTFILKGALGLMAGALSRVGRNGWKGSTGKAVLGSVAGTTTYGVLYLCKTFFYSGLLIKGLTTEAAWLTVLAKIPATLFNAFVAIIFAPPLAVALYHALKAAKLRLD